MIKKLAPYRKFITATIGALIGWGSAVVISEPEAITSSEWMMLAVGVGTALGVYQVPNAPLTRR